MQYLRCDRLKFFRRHYTEVSVSEGLSFLSNSLIQWVEKLNLCVGFLTSGHVISNFPAKRSRESELVYRDVTSDHATSIFPLSIAGKLNWSIGNETSGHVTSICPTALKGKLTWCIDHVAPRYLNAYSVSTQNLARNARADGRTTFWDWKASLKYCLCFSPKRTDALGSEQLSGS